MELRRASRMLLRMERQKNDLFENGIPEESETTYSAADQLEIREQRFRNAVKCAVMAGQLQEFPTPVKEMAANYSKTADNVVLEDPVSHTADGDVVPESNVLYAATMVTDAKEGRHSDYVINDRSIRLYRFYYHPAFFYLQYLFILFNHALAVFEKPAIPGFELHYGITIALEMTCLLFYTLRLVHSSMFLPTIRFWHDRKNLTLIITIALTFMDIMSYIGLMNSEYEKFAHRWSRPMRPVFMVSFTESKQIRRAFRNIRRTLPDILNVLILFFLSIAIFSLMGLKLFQNRDLKFPDGSKYFNDYFDIFFDLYVLVTTANFPDIMMPAYDDNKLYSIYFVTYLLICLYIFMNIFLAVVYNNYRKHLKNEVRKVVYMKRKSLAKAFEFLKVQVDNRCFVTYKRFQALVAMLPPKRSTMMTGILWYVLDKNGDGELDKGDFLLFADLLNVGVSEIKDRKNNVEKAFPNIYNSKTSVIFRKIVAHVYFRYVFDVLIVANAVLIAFDVTEVEWVFLSLFTFEIICKMYTFGTWEFFKRYWNVFDFFVIGAAIIATSAETMLGNSALVKTRTLDVILVLRVLRLVKIIGSIERFQVIVTTIVNLGTSILTYGGVLFVVYYVFAIIGMDIFQGKIEYFGYDTNLTLSKQFCGNPKLNQSIFLNSQYCSNNFNNIYQTMVLLFELMVVNQWHVLTSGFVLVTSKTARAYFFLFHLTSVIIVLNIFTAFVLEAFILEYSFNKSSMETKIEKKIEEMGLQIGGKKSSASDEEKSSIIMDMELPVDSDHNSLRRPADMTDGHRRRASSVPNVFCETDIRFHLSKSKDVENLLQRMFENELDVEDTGPDDINVLDNIEDTQGPIHFDKLV